MHAAAMQPIERDRAVVGDDEWMGDARFGEGQARQLDVVQVLSLIHI